MNQTRFPTNRTEPNQTVAIQNFEHATQTTRQASVQLAVIASLHVLGASILFNHTYVVQYLVFVLFCFWLVIIVFYKCFV